MNKSIKTKTKTFWNNNKEKIKTGAIIGAKIIAVAGVGFLIYDDINKTIQLKNALEENKFLKEIINRKNQTIIDLQNLCYQKDVFFKGFISKLLRQGNSEGARQMRYRREYLETIEKAQIQTLS